MISVRRSEGSPSDPSDIYSLLYELNPNAKVCKGFEVAYIGPSVGDRPVAVYDYECCVETVMEVAELEEDDATTYFYWNTLSNCDGKDAPIFVRCRPW